MSHVLFDIPGPKARRRNAVIGVVSTLLLLALLGWMFLVLWENDQFTEQKLSFLEDPDIWEQLGEGLLFNLKAAGMAIALALVFGAVFASGRLSDHRLLRWPSLVVVEFFRAVPLILLILFIFLLTEGEISRYWCLVLGLTLYNGAVLAEIFRAGILSIPRGQSEAAYATGMRKNQVMRLILIPQSVTAMLPAIISQCVVALKDTTLGIIISTPDVVQVGRLIFTSPLYNNAIVVGLFLAVVFIIINYSLSKLAVYVERRVSKRGKKVVHLEEVESGIGPGAF